MGGRDIFAGTIARRLERPHNAFAVLRLALAVAVVVSHAGSVGTGSVVDEPLAAWTGFTLGEHAVNGFFAVSGFLVTMSFDRRGPRDYALARVLRIVPGLVAATLAVALVLGPAMSRLPPTEYLRDPGLWRFVEGTLTAFKSNAALPGVFLDNPYRSPLGTVWTLKYEVLCYLGVLVVGLAGFLRRRWALPALAVALAIALVAAEARLAPLPKHWETNLRLPLIFCTGAALYAARDRVPLSVLPVMAALLAGYCLQGGVLYRAVLFTGEAYGAIWLALGPLARLAPEPKADLSYGIYLYGWPIQQSLYALAPGLPPVALLAASLVLVVPVAALSWYAVEQPGLRLKARALRGRAPRAAQPMGP
ncbi:acyltransferase family protein [Methylobacterium aerolatum]|uniref:Peptidoglycan/LPS O-acetylase OafA/YrhL n=1 Tax=Methylobacterium aerolatum TaxID=418708 RepID=A0ABU0HZV4_9HYPH|nr:acyltransferase [Methylobacterium aerolatum]MDQ0447872.1 peptidoglycan/LPS O-acetylase OafA/YrhL [Methylobacterium aerolatum]GJD34421.1 hypothetical protein FMGBMHLM_1320 [Methylobacterium aerolatum]